MAKILTLDLPDEAATADLGRRLAPLCRAGDVIALRGDLGAGKSTLARALIQTLQGADTEVPSPTFTLVQTYPGDLPTGLAIWHFDLYRLENPAEARELGIEEAADGLTLVEWPERLGSHLPKTRLELQLSFSGAGRIARLDDHADWSERINGDWR